MEYAVKSYRFDLNTGDGLDLTKEALKEVKHLRDLTKLGCPHIIKTFDTYIERERSNQANVIYLRSV
jgi:hypothetical protein